MSLDITESLITHIRPCSDELPSYIEPPKRCPNAVTRSFQTSPDVLHVHQHGNRGPAAQPRTTTIRNLNHHSTNNSLPHHQKTSHPRQPSGNSFSIICCIIVISTLHRLSSMMMTKVRAVTATMAKVTLPSQLHLHPLLQPRYSQVLRR